MLLFELRPSVRARRVRAAGRVLTAVAALACLWIALARPDAIRVAAAVAALAAASLTWRTRGPDGPQALRIDPAGRLSLGAPDRLAAADPVHCSRHYVALRTHEAVAVLWPDMLPRAGWRRLQVACRWPAAADRVAAPTQPTEDRRTKSGDPCLTGQFDRRGTSGAER